MELQAVMNLVGLPSKIYRRESWYLLQGFLSLIHLFALFSVVFFKDVVFDSIINPRRNKSNYQSNKQTGNFLSKEGTGYIVAHFRI